MNSYDHDDDTLAPLPHENDFIDHSGFPLEDYEAAKEEGHYWSTLKDFQELVKLKGADVVVGDFDETTYYALKHAYN